MKILKSISALVLVLGLTTAAEAQTPIVITGSTAFRNQIWAALSDMGLTSVNGYIAKSNSFTFTGTVSDTKSIGLSSSLKGQSVDVFCTFTGSAEGVNTLVTPGATIPVTNAAGTASVIMSAQIAFSDVGQNSTPYAYPLDTSDKLTEIRSAADLAKGSHPGTGMAVQAFAFVGNTDAIAAGISNITQDNFADLFQTGVLGLNFFTGNNSDANTSVYAVGRYDLSGTRICTIEDNNANLFTPLQQVALSPDGTLTPGVLATDSATPAGNQWVALPTTFPGDGYFTGGNVGTAIANSSGTGAGPALAYIGWADAQGKLGTGKGAMINWIGQSPLSSAAATLGTGSAIFNTNGVVNGSYTFWSYERCYVDDADVAGNTFVYTTFGPGLLQAIQYEIVHTNPRTANVESEMNVYRNADGGDVFHY
jgi:hypothetical protein